MRKPCPLYNTQTRQRQNKTYSIINAYTSSLITTSPLTSESNTFRADCRFTQRVPFKISIFPSIVCRDDTVKEIISKQTHYTAAQYQLLQSKKHDSPTYSKSGERGMERRIRHQGRRLLLYYPHNLYSNLIRLSENQRQTLEKISCHSTSLENPMILTTCFLQEHFFF